MSEDLDQLEKALTSKKGEDVTNITLKYKTNAERVKLRQEYQKKFGRDLIQDIDKYMKSDLKNTLLAMYKDPVEYDTDLLYYAMKGVGSNKETITDVLCFRDFDRLNKIKQKFKEKYGKDLVPEIKSETSGVYQKVAMNILEKERSKNTSPDLDTCKKIAEELHKAGEEKLGTNDEVFINYFSNLSGEELALVGKEYDKNYKKNLVEVIQSEFSGINQDILIGILYGLINPSEYFARIIFKCVDGAGTADDRLIRSIVARAEVDMDLIKRFFKQIFNKDMIERVKEDSSGDYSRLLEFLMSNN